MAKQYRMLEKGEKLQKGDECRDYGGEWFESHGHKEGARFGDPGYSSGPYRRLLPDNPQPWFPSYKCSQTPQRAIHVAWAETPAYVALVGQNAVEATPEAPMAVGEGYRLLGPEEIVEKGDEFWLSDGKWAGVRGSIGEKAGIMEFTYRRKLSNEAGESNWKPLQMP